MSQFISPVQQASQVPSQTHFAILTFERCSEESYGETDTRTVARYTVYPTRQLWEDEVRKLVLSKTEHVPLVSYQPEVKTQVNITIK